jgi:hypothetical protein
MSSDEVMFFVELGEPSWALAEVPFSAEIMIFASVGLK